MTAMMSDLVVLTLVTTGLVVSRIERLDPDSDDDLRRRDDARRKPMAGGRTTTAAMDIPMNNSPARLKQKCRARDSLNNRRATTPVVMHLVRIPGGWLLVGWNVGSLNDSDGGQWEALAADDTAWRAVVELLFQRRGAVVVAIVSRHCCSLLAPMVLDSVECWSSRFVDLLEDDNALQLGTRIECAGC
jgi:hypothetical protein